VHDRLLPFLLLLTLLDLAFVQATGIVSGQGLLPLWLLAAAAPWLRLLQRRLSCRIAWNGGVLIVFALLVRHATTTGLLYMLEDGLVLAVLCQVHLLNNIGERQRPDLVFFNSLLVAFVTSFFAPDLYWSFLFVLHAFVLVAALQVNVLVRRGVMVERPVVRQVVRHAVAHAVAVLAVTALLFAALPRDFARQGWLGKALSHQDDGEAGLADRIRLGDEHPMRLGTEIVAQITAADANGAIPTHWRAIAFAEFDGSTWYPQAAGPLGSRFASDPGWSQGRDGNWQRDGSGDVGPTQRFAVRLHDMSSARLPLPLPAVRMLPQQVGGTLLDSKSFGGFVLLQAQDTPAGPIAYAVDVAAVARAASVSAATRRKFVAMPDRGVPKVARALAEQLRTSVADGADAATLARTAADWLRENRRYALPGEPGFAHNLGEFLLGSGAGHCEYFATALALLLRLQNVPCRLVGGWLAHERDPADTGVVVRMRDAHAWVEVLAEDGRWFALDATPAIDLGAARDQATSWLAVTQRQLEDWWGAVVGFDGTRRGAWLQAALALPGRLGRALVSQPLFAAAVLALIALLAYRRRRRQHEPAIVALERAVRAAGLSLQAGETPRELLLRAAAAGVEPARLTDLEQAALHHERLRYGAVAARSAPGVSRP
jgi:protein-glutamine gamma-glutamyltransferase